MDALKIISAEHRGLWRLITAIDQICHEMQRHNSAPDAVLFTAIFDYIETYIDQMHHPKEDDYLFRVMWERSEASHAVITLLKHEHHDGPQNLSGVRYAFQNFVAGFPTGAEAFYQALGDYTKGLRQHIKVEETELMPLAKQILREEDWAEINAAFANNDDPLFGEVAKAEFRQLHARITHMAPDPVGLGMAHPEAKPVLKNKPALKPSSPIVDDAPVLLEVASLTSFYGRIQALRGIELCIRQGELVALVGANGAGKTTLLRAISGVQPVASGNIRFAGEDITKLRADIRVRRGICQVPEGRQVFGPLSIEDNLRLGAFTQNKTQVADDMERMYTMFPILKEKRHLPAGTLSGGQQQMLAMGRALMGRPRLLLLDEPSMGLAPLLVEEIFNAVKTLKAEGMTIFLVEQNAHAALSVADTGYVIEIGETTLSGPGLELLENEQVKAAYLGM